MKARHASFLSFAALCFVGLAVSRPVTVVEVTSMEPAVVHGWTGTADSGSRTALEPQAAPFRLVVRDADFQARFVTEPGGPKIHVRAVHKRAWLPLTRVGAEGPAISLEGRGSFMGIRTP